MRYFALIALSLTACKPGAVALNLETCDVPQTTILTESTATTDVYWVCSPPPNTVLYTDVYEFRGDGTLCTEYYDTDDTFVIGGCDGTWTRPSCSTIETTTPSDPTRETTAIDLTDITPTTEGFSTNIALIQNGGPPDTRAYTCQKASVPK